MYPGDCSTDADTSLLRSTAGNKLPSFLPQLRGLPQWRLGWQVGELLDSGWPKSDGSHTQKERASTASGRRTQQNQLHSILFLPLLLLDALTRTIVSLPFSSVPNVPLHLASGGLSGG